MTPNGGLGELQEWVALYVAANPDSAFSLEGNWQYLDGTQEEPTASAVYSVTLNFTD